MSASSKQHFEQPPDFSLVLGGPLYQLFRRMRLTGDALELLYRRTIFITLFCWMPLFILAMLQGQLWEAELAVPFLRDAEVHVRFLVVVPLLIVAELIVHRRLRLVVAQFLDRNLIAPHDMPRFESAYNSANRLRNSMVAELLLIGFVYVVGVLVVWRHFVSLNVDSWYFTESGGAWNPSLAGLWYGFVGLPIFQFLLVRWYFRIFIWARFLWQVSRIPLRLVPTHPDRAGGLGFLSGTAYAFVPLLMAHGAMLAGLIAGRIFHLNQTLMDFKFEALAVIVFLLCVVQGPLLFFSLQLAEMKRVGKSEYGTLAQQYTRSFDTKWLRGGAATDESFLGSADIQSLADLGNSYEIVQSVRLSLTTREAIVTFAGAVIAPLIPLFLTMMSLEDLLKKLIGLLF